MIPGSAVEAYLARQLDSNLWVKGLTEEQLDVELARLRPAPQLNPKLRIHQKAAFLLGVAQPHFCYWLEMGVGKTILALELLKYWFQCGLIKRALIFVTSDKAFPTWKRQLKQFGIDLPLTELSGSSEQKWQQLSEAQDGLILLPYPSTVAMVALRPQGKKGNWKLDPKKVAQLATWAGGLVLDESTKAGSYRSLTFALINQLRKSAAVRYALAGRPFGSDPTMLWAQHYLIDGGETLGETLGLFRSAFFTEKANYWGGPYSKDYTFKQKMRPELARMIQHRSITYSADECIDLPDVPPLQIETVSLPEEANAYYQRMVEQVISAKGNLRETKNAFLRMRQISSGFVGFKDDETGEKAEFEFEQNPKLERLLELIEEVPEGRGAIIFYEFTKSGRRIVEELKKMGYKPIWLWAGTKNSAAELDRFAKEAQPVAVIQSKVGAMSLDGLQWTASFDFEFEAPLSAIDYDQARKRLIRDGQKHKVFSYTFEVEGTVDSRIREYREAGQSLFDALVRNPAKTLRV